MSFRSQWRIRCDACMKESRHKDNNSNKAEIKALHAGWLARWHKYGMFHLCPECAKSPPDWWPKEAEATT